MAGQGDTINIVWSGTFGSSATPWSMVKDYRITAINNAGSLSAWLATCAGTYTAAWTTALLAMLADEFTFDRAEAFNRNDLTEGATLTIDIDGTGNADGLPLRMAAVILKETGLRGRSYLGRMSFPAILGTLQDNGILDDAVVAALTTWAGATRILGDATNQGHLTVYSPTLSTPDIVFNTLVSSYTIRNVMGSIRGRQPVT